MALWGQTAVVLAQAAADVAASAHRPETRSAAQDGLRAVQAHRRRSRAGL